MTLRGTLRETLAIFEQNGEPKTTTEVTESLDVGRRSTYERLQQLVDRGHLETKKVGASARVWWRPPADDDGRRPSVSGDDGQHHREERRDDIQRRYDELEGELDTVFDRITDGFYALDENLRILYMNDHAADVLGLEDAAIGREFLNAVTVTDAFEQALEEALDTQETVIVEDYYEPVDKWFYSAIYPSEDGLSIYFRDITERKEYEQELERYVAIVNAVDEPVYELDLQGRFTFVNEALVQHSGYEEEELLGQHVSIGMDDETIARSEAKIQELLAEGPEGTITLEYDVVTKSGDRFPAENRISLLTDENGQIRGSAGVIWDITERKERENELERQREALATLNNLNTIVSEITETVIELSTREEIEQAVCDTLAATDSYEFAWIAGIGSQKEAFEPRATAKTTGYGENLSIPFVTDDPDRSGPGSTALREQETQVIQDVFADPDFEPWRDEARKYGFTSLAVIPVAHEGTIYSVLVVYADRQNAFDTAEREVISRLGEVVGHAIASIDRKRALLTEEVVELTFQVRNLFEEFDLPVEPTGRITFDELVPLKNEASLVYGTTTADAKESLESISKTLPRWESVTFYEDDGDSAFELQLSESTVLSTIASMGGSLQQAVIDDGDYHLTVHLPPGGNIRELIETVKESYPDVEMLTRHQTTQSDRTGIPATNVLSDELTERQRTTLQAAYHAGFFEWPRDSSGEAVAESLDIAPSTFHHHLRKAQKKVIESVLSAE